MTNEELLAHYLELGWVLVPSKNKIPRVKQWQKHDGFTDIRAFEQGGYEPFLICGARSGVTVIDLDSEEEVDRWMPLVKHTNAPVATSPSGGIHIYVQYDARFPHTIHQNDTDIDIRTADLGGVVLPWTGNYRGWLADYSMPWDGLPAPEPFLRFLDDRGIRAAGTENEDKGDTKTGLPSQERSHLAQLLDNPPTEGSRNDWLTKVAGHLVKRLNHEDSFLAVIQAINRSLPAPLPTGEVTETVGQLFGRDRDRHGAVQQSDGRPEPGTSSEAGGFDPEIPIVRRSGSLFYVKTDKEGTRTLHPYLLPALWPTALKVTSDGHRIFTVTDGTRTYELAAKLLGNTSRLKEWLAGHGFTIPFDPNVLNLPHGNLLGDYLYGHRLEPTLERPAWGWDDELEEWVGIEGTAVGPSSDPPTLGTLDRPDIISKLPTWQDDELAAVFCAWVAVQATKGKVNYGTEPNIVLQGMAGAGKTRGLFSFASRLTGTTRQDSGTEASIRDRLASQRNGIIVIDDHTDVNSGALLELFRLSTSGGSKSKKGQGATGQWDSTVNIKLRGSMVVSGESLSRFGSDRALRDRSIILEVPPSSERRSLDRPEVSQWEDILAVFESLGGTDESSAHQLAGGFVRRLLDVVDLHGGPEISTHGDRVGGKINAIRHGARLWQAAYPDSRTYEGLTVPQAVERWADNQRTQSTWEDTNLVRAILPVAVDPNAGAIYACRIDDGQIIFHLPSLSRWWIDRNRMDPRQKETGSEENLRREVDLLVAEGLAEKSVQIRMSGTNKRCIVVAGQALQAVLQHAELTGEDTQIPLHPKLGKDV